MIDYTKLISDGAMIAFLNRSITGAVVIAIIMLLRLLLKRMPKRYLCLLWLAPLVRLLIPFSFTAPFSLLPVNARPLVEVAIPQGTVLTFYSGIAPVDNRITGSLLLNTMPRPLASADPLPIYLYVAKIIWVLGMALFLTVNLYRYFRLKRRLRDSVPAASAAAASTGAEVRFSDRISMPMAVGVRKPRIFLPSIFSGAEYRTEKEFVIAHEQAHIRRLDYLTKTAAFAALAVHWFNPFVWAMFVLLCRDMEMACDESVLRQVGEGGKKDYSLTLLHFKERQSALLIPLAFGESHTKSRIKNILNYKKPPFWIGVAALVVLLFAAVTLLTDPEPPMSGSTAIIGGADGPTSIFLAGKTGGTASFTTGKMVLTIGDIPEITVYDDSQKFRYCIEAGADGTHSIVLKEVSELSQEEFSELERSRLQAAEEAAVKELEAALRAEYGDSGVLLLAGPSPMLNLDVEAYGFLAADIDLASDGAAKNGDPIADGMAGYRIWYGVWRKHPPFPDGGQIQKIPLN